MREQIEMLINSDITADLISKETGITLSVVQKVLAGESELDNISFKNAEKLYTFWDKNKVDITLRIINKATEGKLKDSLYFEGYQGVWEMRRELGMTTQDIKNRTYLIDYDFNKLEGPFIVRDYGGEDFEYLTEFNKAAIDDFIHRLLLP